jgi:predicted signal transduction protein with EAL and GGDEF domain
VGYSVDPRGGATSEQLIQAADEALMSVKLTGKNAARCSGSGVSGLQTAAA